MAREVKSQDLEPTVTRTRQSTAKQAGSGCGAAAVQSLKPGAWQKGEWERGQEEVREGPASWVFQVRAPSTQEPLATLLWTPSSACLQPAMHSSAVSSLCSHPETEEAGGRAGWLLAAPGRRKRKGCETGQQAARGIVPTL